MIVFTVEVGTDVVPPTRERHPSTKAIRILEAAIARVEDELEEMRTAHAIKGGCPCCVGAAHGGTVGRYDRLAAKLIRQEEWLAVLIDRERSAVRRLAKSRAA